MIAKEKGEFALTGNDIIVLVCVCAFIAIVAVATSLVKKAEKEKTQR